MTKQEQINKRLDTPIKIGDKVNVSIKYIQKSSKKIGKKFITEEVEAFKNGSGIVKKIIETQEHGILYAVKSDYFSVPNEVSIKNYADYGDNCCKAEWVSQSIDDCGANNFKPSPKINFTNQCIWQLINKVGYSKTDDYNKLENKVINGKSPDDEKYLNCTYGGVNFDPYIIDKDGKKTYYQRGYVWNEDQKRLLIDSVYNGIEIGKFLFRYKSWEHIQEQMLETGHGYDFDCVDGKQRMNALLEFVQDKFKDSYGCYFSDLSACAKREFLDYGRLAVGTMDENTQDKDVINAFLFVNFTGTPMSKEHLEHVKSIKI